MQTISPSYDGPNPSACRAFSLMELLISVGIVAVLASLLLPAVRGAITRGHSAKDAANLRAIAQANIVYAAENDQRCVIGFTTVPSGLSKTWYSELRPYLDKGAGSETNRVGYLPVLVSPCDPTKGGIRGSNAISPDNYARRSYGINYYTREFISGSTKEYRGRKMSMLPLSTMIFVGNFPAVQEGTHGISPNSEASLAALPRNWHSVQDMAQFVFLDGHVEMINVDDLQSNGKRYAEAWGPTPSTVSK